MQFSYIPYSNEYPAFGKIQTGAKKSGLRQKLKKALVLFSVVFFNIYSVSGNFWTPKTPLNEARSGAITFTIGEKAYIGLGQSADGTKMYDLWEYDRVLDTWTRKADYPGLGGYAATAFVINGKGYVCLGQSSTGANAGDLWEYSPITDTWQKKADFPGVARYGASAFVIGETAFVGTGSSGGYSSSMKDMYMYDPAADKWSKTVDFPGGKRFFSTAFTIGDYGYLGTGLSDTETPLKDIWRYRKANNTWAPVPDFPAKGRFGVTSVVINHTAYIGTGRDFQDYFSDFYGYDAETNSWEDHITSTEAGMNRILAVSFTFKNTIYLATGYSSDGIALPDLWYYDQGANPDDLQIPSDPCRKPTEGTDFWFGFMSGHWYIDGEPLAHNVEITISSRFNAELHITIGPSEIPYGGPIFITANNAKQIEIDWKLVEAIGSQDIENKAVHISSDWPVNVYVRNNCANSSDVSVVFPTASLGKKYYTMCFDPQIREAHNMKFSQFMIVGVQDNTVLQITPTRDTYLGKNLANNPFTITLNKGQVYQVQSEHLSGLSAPGACDMTGTYIEGDKTFAVFSGSLATKMPYKSHGTWDFLFEQMPPIQAWGKEYLTVPLKTRTSDRFRIIATEDSTKVNVEGVTEIDLNRGEMHEVVLASDKPSKVVSNKKIMIGQFSESSVADENYTRGIGYSIMMILSSVTQTVKDVTFVIYESLHVQKNYINIVTRTDQTGNIRLDGSNISNYFLPYKNSIYSYAQIELKQDRHTMNNNDPNGGFSAYVYGISEFESFGYGVGFNLDVLLNLGKDTILNGRKTYVGCPGDPPLELNAGFGFDKYLWNTGDTVMSIKITDPGTYWSKIVVDGCTTTDDIDYFIDYPVVDLGNDTLICNPDRYILDAGAGFKSYNWSTNETSQTINPFITNDYWVHVIDVFGCPARDTVRLSFFDRPKLNLSRLDTLICGEKSALLDLSADKGVYSLSTEVQGVVFNGLNVTVPSFATYQIRYTATDTTGCYTSAPLQLSFHKTPSVSISIDSITCYRYSLDATYRGDADPGLANFTWEFGSVIVADSTGLVHETIPLGTSQTKRDLSLRVSQEGCSNADTVKNIAIKPDLELQVADSAGCQPFTAEFIAQSEEAESYFWNFGDGWKEQSGSHSWHTYKNPGYYNVSLKVVTGKGCSNRIVMDSIVHVAPVRTVGFSLSPDECLGAGPHEISYTGTGDENDTYLWDLSDFTSGEIIRDPLNAKGPFVFELIRKPSASIALTVISDLGCRSDTGRITVKRLPAITINLTDSTGCVPLETGFSALQSDPVDRIIYTWDFGDSTQGTGMNVMHSYSDAGKTFGISLTASSELTGCSFFISKPSVISAYPVPGADFSISPAVIYNTDPVVSFVNKSVGALSWFWDFGDGSFADEKDPSHRYVRVGNRRVLLRAVNQYSCSDTVSHEILVAYNQLFPPNAFSPNAPNEVDREFRITEEGVESEGYHLVILSRWNDIVFETRNEIKGWDGRTRDGSNAPAGNYVWILDFSDFLGKKHRQTGTVTLVY